MILLCFASVYKIAYCERIFGCLRAVTSPNDSRNKNYTNKTNLE